MNLSQRHLDILEMAKQKGFLPTEEMSRVFNVTAQTIRRDINELCDKGLLRRYHGGAGLASSVQNVDYPTRQVLNHEEKIRIARMVADYIPDNASLFINIGTTTEEVAKALRDHKNLRVITNNLNVARIGNSTTFPEVFQHLPPIVNRNFPPGSSDLSWNPCLFP